MLYIIGIVSSSPTDFHSEIGLIRVTYDPPVCYRVKYFLFRLSHLVNLSLILRFGCIELDFKEISYLVHFKAQSYESNNKATLESVGDDVEDIKKDQSAIQSRVANMEEKLDLILDIMQSRYKPPVDRL